MVSPYFLRQGVVFAWAYITSHGSQHTLTKNDSDFFYLIFVGIKNPVPLLLKFYDNLLVCQPIIDGYVLFGGINTARLSKIRTANRLTAHKMFHIFLMTEGSPASHFVLGFKPYLAFRSVVEQPCLTICIHFTCLHGVNVASGKLRCAQQIVTYGLCRSNIRLHNHTAYRVHWW